MTTHSMWLTDQRESKKPEEILMKSRVCLHCSALLLMNETFMSQECVLGMLTEPRHHGHSGLCVYVYVTFLALMMTLKTTLWKHDLC